MENDGTWCMENEAYYVKSIVWWVSHSLFCYYDVFDVQDLCMLYP